MIKLAVRLIVKRFGKNIPINFDINGLQGDIRKITNRKKMKIFKFGSKVLNCIIDLSQAVLHLYLIGLNYKCLVI